MRCFECNKISISGNSRSFSNIANKRRFLPNLHALNLKKIIDIFNNFLIKKKKKTIVLSKKKIYLCSKCLRLFKKKIFIDKNLNFIKIKIIDIIKN